jgi:hypothetical protein
LRAAAELILNDDVDGAEEGLAGRNSAFHLLGRAVVMFIRATLGFEQDVMRQGLQHFRPVFAAATHILQRRIDSTKPKTKHTKTNSAPKTMRSHQTFITQRSMHLVPSSFSSRQWRSSWVLLSAY